MPSGYYLPITLVLLGVIGIALLAWRRGTGTGRSLYRAVPLLSPAEVDFYHCLVQLYGASAIICPKVRLVDLIRPSQVLNVREFQIALNRVVRRHVDFVILRNKDFVVLGVVELDDRSHERQDRFERDLFVDAALRQAGIPICRVKALSEYDLQKLHAQLSSSLAPIVVKQTGK